MKDVIKNSRNLRFQTLATVEIIERKGDGEMKEKKPSPGEQFGQEFKDIEYELRSLKEGRIYGYRGNSSTGDGALHSTVEKIKRLVDELGEKIRKSE